MCVYRPNFGSCLPGRSLGITLLLYFLFYNAIPTRIIIESGKVYVFLYMMTDGMLQWVPLGNYQYGRPVAEIISRRVRSVVKASPRHPNFSTMTSH